MTVVWLTYFAFLEALSWGTSQIPPCIVPASYQATKNAGGNECPTLHIFLIELAAVVFEKLGDPHTATAVFTALLFAATFFLWLATRSLVNDGKQNAERQLRAYLLVTKGEIGVPEAIPDNTIINLTVRNFGNTPAYSTTIWADMVYDRDPLVGTLVGTRNPKVSTTIFGPGGRQTTSFYKTSLNESQKHAMAHHHGAAIYVFGEIRYTDAFGKKRCTKFRCVQRGGPEFRDKPMAFCDEGNEAT